MQMRSDLRQPYVGIPSDRGEHPRIVGQENPPA
jgi:hypothetical protein